MGHGVVVAHDPSGPSGHLPAEQGGKRLGRREVARADEGHEFRGAPGEVVPGPSGALSVAREPVGYLSRSAAKAAAGPLPANPSARCQMPSLWPISRTVATPSARARKWASRVSSEAR